MLHPCAVPQIIVLADNFNLFIIIMIFVDRGATSVFSGCSVPTVPSYFYLKFLRNCFGG